MKVLPLFLAVLTISACERTSGASEGVTWRFPEPRDLTGDWATANTRDADPFHFTADFDGNGISDGAWLVIEKETDGWQLLAIMNEWEDIATLNSSQTGRAQWFGITKIEPGTYQTACGKGYWDCASDEPESLVLTRPAIRFFKFESASWIYYWDDENSRFAEVAESD